MAFELLVGADPELFLKADGQFQSGYGVIPGTKANPFPVEDGAIQVDGMAVEFNITPAANEANFVKSVQKVMQELRGMVPQHFDLSISPVAHFTPELMASQPEEALMLGCDPDYNAYTGEENKKPDQHPVMRTAAGHIHLGWCEGRDKMDYKHFMSCCELVKILDAYLGLPSVILDPDIERKQMYGKAGAFRPKSYGCEYRVMSNFWLRDEATMRWAYNNTKLGFDKLVRGNVGYIHCYEKLIQRVINTNDKKEAKRMCQELGIPFGIKEAHLVMAS